MNLLFHLTKAQLPSTFAVSIFVGLSLAYAPAKASALQFSCDTRGGYPVTFLETQGKRKPIIYWVLDFTEPGPQDRCISASERLQRAHENGTLNYLVVRRIDNQEILCASDTWDGECKEWIFPLTPGSDATGILGRVLDLRGLQNGRAIEQGDEQELYIDFEKYINRIPPEREE